MSVSPHACPNQVRKWEVGLKITKQLAGIFAGKGGWFGEVPLCWGSKSLHSSRSGAIVLPDIAMLQVLCKYAQTKRDFNTIHSVRGNKLQNTTKKTRWKTPGQVILETFKDPPTWVTAGKTAGLGVTTFAGGHCPTRPCYGHDGCGWGRWVFVQLKTQQISTRQPQ